MGRSFDTETLEKIQQASGGYPFLSRQVVSLLKKKVNRGEDGLISITKAQTYLSKTLKYSGTLKDFFKHNIWADLEKRNFQSAMDCLQILACNQVAFPWFPEPLLVERLQGKYSEEQIWEALRWLEQTGILEQREQDGEDFFQIRMSLFTKWILRQKPKEERSCNGKFHPRKTFQPV